MILSGCDSFSVGSCSVDVSSELFSTAVEIVTCVMAWTKSRRICLGSVIPEYSCLVRNGGRTQKDFSFFYCFDWVG